MIYSYLDTLLKKWIQWNESFLSTQIPSTSNDLNLILGSKGSDNPSRANEFYRIGVLKYPLTDSIEGFQQLQSGNNIQTSFGFICYLIMKGAQLSSSNIKINRALGIVSSFALLQQFEIFNNGNISLNCLFHYLLEKFPEPQDINKVKYLRYLSASMFCELNTDRESLYSSVINGSTPRMRLIQREPYKIIATFSTSADISKAIEDNLSLTGIIYEKGSTFFIGDSRSSSPRGLFYRSYLSCQDLLYSCYLHEIVNLVNNPFNTIFAKDSSHEFLNLLLTIIDNTGYNIKFRLEMKSLKEGCLEAIKLLEWDDKRSIDYGKDLNIIFYGAPGTGKSFKVEQILGQADDEYKERITFHPEYDHSAFVGGYKPISEENSSGVTEIKYKFVPQVFTEIYIKAWKNLDKSYYLAIEEINRGNCAEIFGDIFQLLDRTSNYSISPSIELKDHLRKELGADHEGILNGKIKLPPNLYLYATMNTSDQSLFPIDSAFKRRWSWEYIPINYNKDETVNESAGYMIELGENGSFKWIDFIEKVNKDFIINNPNLREDKCIGNYFIKPDSNIISLEVFINKAIFYLWIDVFKDEVDSIFDQDITFESFFPIETNGLKMVTTLVSKLGILIPPLPKP